jgi:PAS domain S-box-containing protein
MFTNKPTVDPLRFLKGGGEMGNLTRTYNWHENIVGPASDWPQSLLTTLGIMLNSRFPMFLWWGNDLIQFYNDAYRPSLGNKGKHPSALGQKGIDCWPEIWPVIKPLIDQVMGGGDSVYFEDQLIPIYRNNKLEDVYWTFSYSPVIGESGNVEGILVVCTETTNQVLEHQEMKHAKDELDFAIQAAELGTWDLDPASNKFVGNERLKSWFGLNADDRIELSKAVDVILKDDRERVANAIAHSMTYESGGLYDIEYAILNHIDNTPRYVRAKGKCIFDKDKNPIRFSGTLQDVTGERIAREDLKDTNQRLELALNAGDLGSYDVNLQTMEFICNAQYKANFGYREDEECGIPDFIDAILPEFRPDVLSQRDYAISTNTLYHAEYPVTWPDGSIHWIRVYGKPYYGNDGNAVRIIGVSIDITQEINSQKELERLYEQMRLSKEAAQLGTFDMDLVKGTMEWDDRCRSLFGISHSNTVTYEDDFLPGLHPEDKERITAIIQNVFIKSISNGDYDVEYRTVGTEDKKLRWVRAKGKTYFDEQDRPLRFIGSVLDITEQKMDELRKNDFISMVSHELKTPLTSLKAYIQMLLDPNINTENFMEGALQKADIQIKRMGALIDGFLNVSRLESGKLLLYKDMFDVNDLIEGIREDAALIFASHKIKTTFNGTLTVFADKEKIGSVVLNLLSNAVKYSPKESTIYIDCVKQKDFVKISVRDEGMGIKEQDIKKLFERFYRVENHQNRFVAGFGIGLYLCAEIIKVHGGTIWAESEFNIGSSFHFTLPLVNA